MNSWANWAQSIVHKTQIKRRSIQLETKTVCISRIMYQHYEIFSTKVSSFCAYIFVFDFVVGNHFFIFS